jgi:hypothetical protein
MSSGDKKLPKAIKKILSRLRACSFTQDILILCTYLLVVAKRRTIARIHAPPLAGRTPKVPGLGDGRAPPRRARFCLIAVFRRVDRRGSRARALASSRPARSRALACVQRPYKDTFCAKCVGLMIPNRAKLNIRKRILTPQLLYPFHRSLKKWCIYINYYNI